MVVDVIAVHGIAVAAGTGVDSYIFAFVRGEAVEDFVVEVDEGVEQFGAGPGVAGVVLGGEASFGEVDADAFGAGGEGSADVFFALLRGNIRFG
jgi:hypothetical protein